jgi:hypothetical protein
VAPVEAHVRQVVDIERAQFRAAHAHEMLRYILDRRGQDDHLGDVEFRCGTVLSGVIERCLTGLDLSPSSQSRERLQEEFYKQVVQRLEQCHI